jgi:hypothetical protein
MGAPAPESPSFPRTFVIVLFVGAAIVGGVVAYLGVTGQLGAGIP